MKKTTNSNPLKYFNDAAAAKAKSVIAGNDKLVKAQAGIVKQGPMQKSNIDKLNKMYPGTAFTPPKGPYSPEVLQNMKDAVARPLNYIKGDPDYGINKSTSEKKDREYFENQLRQYNYFKKGGAVKSKKK